MRGVVIYGLSTFLANIKKREIKKQSQHRK